MNSETPAEAAAAEDERRAEYIKGMRALADALERNTNLPLPYQGSDSAMTMMFLSGDNPRSEMAAAARALPCNWDKKPWESDSATYFDLTGKLDGLRMTLTAFRKDVCERVVTGTREVTETVKDPDALAAVPEIKVTRTVEEAEWVCRPLLTPEAGGAA